MNYKLFLLIILTSSCSTSVDKLTEGVNNINPYLTDKNLLEINLYMPIPDDSVTQFLNASAIHAPTLRIDTGLIKHTEYVIPTVLVYMNGKKLDRNICNAHLPRLIEHIENWEKTEQNWKVDNNLPIETLRASIIGYNNHATPSSVEVFYFYTIFYDNLVKNQMLPLYQESLKTNQNVSVYFVNIDNHPGTNLSDVEFGNLVSKHNPYVDDKKVQIIE